MIFMLQLPSNVWLVWTEMFLSWNVAYGHWFITISCGLASRRGLSYKATGERLLVKGAQLGAWKVSCAKRPYSELCVVFAHVCLTTVHVIVWRIVSVFLFYLHVQNHTPSSSMCWCYKWHYYIRFHQTWSPTSQFSMYVVVSVLMLQNNDDNDVNLFFFINVISCFFSRIKTTS